MLRSQPRAVRIPPAYKRVTRDKKQRCWIGDGLRSSRAYYAVGGPFIRQGRRYRRDPQATVGYILGPWDCESFSVVAAHTRTQITPPRREFRRSEERFIR